MNSKHWHSIIVGAGPAGSSCAWQLARAGHEVLILEKSPFPRTKLCAGWITDKVMQQLQFSCDDYPHPIKAIEVRYHWPAIPIAIARPFPDKHNYSIRRIEFDDWLLKRSGATVLNHCVKQIEYSNGRYLIDNQFSCEHLIGAGGTACPVRRSIFPEKRSKANQVSTLEKEFYYPQRAQQTHLFFSYRGLDGYAWYFPKGDGYLNVGLGAFSQWLKNSKENIHKHFEWFMQDLNRLGLLDADTAKNLGETGHSYFVAANNATYKKDNCYLIGDALGLATHDLAEGIGPAVESGLAAADEILGTGEYDASKISRYSFHGLSRLVLRKERHLQ